MTARVDLTIQQGATFQYTARWYGDKVMRAITAVANTAPALLTAVAHGLPSDVIPVWIDGVRGPRLPTGDALKAQRVTDDTFRLLDVDARSLSPYLGGGTLTYYQPQDLTGFTARMQIRRAESATEALFTLTTENGRIALTPAEGRVVLTATATETAALTFTSAVYDLELVSSGGFVTRLLEGNVVLDKETTR